MNTPVYFISDNHFQTTNSHNELERRLLLFNLFEKIKVTGGSLVIGGDFFDFWFDYGNTQMQGYENIFDALEKLNLNGIEIWNDGTNNLNLGLALDRSVNKLWATDFSSNITAILMA